MSDQFSPAERAIFYRIANRDRARPAGRFSQRFVFGTSDSNRTTVEYSESWTVHLFKVFERKAYPPHHLAP